MSEVTRHWSRSDYWRSEPPIFIPDIPKWKVVVLASDYDALRLQLSRGKELLLQALAGLQLSATYLASRPLHDTESGVMHEHALKEQMERISGLTEFLKEVWE